MEAPAPLDLRLQSLITSLFRTDTSEEILQHSESEVSNAVGQRNRGGHATSLARKVNGSTEVDSQVGSSDAATG